MRNKIKEKVYTSLHSIEFYFITEDQHKKIHFLRNSILDHLVQFGKLTGYSKNVRLALNIN